ncbi:MAG: hypothetical protein QM736_26555 [Vicinamibacterales bacterium]
MPVPIRGQAGIGTGMMVEGIPVWAIESPGPRVDMFDLENVDGMTLYRGGVPATQGLGAQDTAGSLDIRLLKPAERAGLTVTARARRLGILADVRYGPDTRWTSAPAPRCSAPIRTRRLTSGKDLAARRSTAITGRSDSNNISEQLLTRPRSSTSTSRR